LLCSAEDSRPEMVSVFPVTCSFTLFAKDMSANCDPSVDFSELAAGVAKGPAGFRFRPLREALQLRPALREVAGMETQPARNFLPLPEALPFDRAPRVELNRRISFQALRNSPPELQTPLGSQTSLVESQTMFLLEAP
jgi:hypothetical protein